jgi:hypothetical protein
LTPEPPPGSQYVDPGSQYLGRWVFGKTTTVYDQRGKKKQVPAREDQQVVVVDRPVAKCELPALARVERT